ncbi:hypothetical protein ABZX65_22595 [Streptomyces sp. NPDC003300]|uniref:hypothetical protein n=1 Tax=unclassified Streptomyces TaxID=2593676 RepID=UPI0033B6E24E
MNKNEAGETGVTSGRFPPRVPRRDTPLTNPLTTPERAWPVLALLLNIRENRIPDRSPWIGSARTAREGSLCMAHLRRRIRRRKAGEESLKIKASAVRLLVLILLTGGFAYLGFAHLPDDGTAPEPPVQPPLIGVVADHPVSAVLDSMDTLNAELAYSLSVDTTFSPTTLYVVVTTSSAPSDTALATQGWTFGRTHADQ